MKRVRATVGAVLCAMVVTAGANAHAAGGRITFTGRVVNPTCAPAAIPSPAQTVPQHLRSQCAGSANPSRYTLQLEPAAAHARSQLVSYYAGYLREGGSTEAVWVATQIYD
ncbi:hypothetical protein [Lysobacter arvi]|uniref:Type 1 fimbrial protein n=1 Tax=Lysobacter arvi TaxID=3038776 RepID=A0ABU1CHX6_9GAMM|nr:hypothetical protein [Lysobacter arvi]MDR0184558.1 hypothetical protein [Lysobacter arvi]